MVDLALTILFYALLLACALWTLAVAWRIVRAAVRREWGPRMWFALAMVFALAAAAVVFSDVGLLLGLIVGFWVTDLIDADRKRHARSGPRLRLVGKTDGRGG